MAFVVLQGSSDWKMGRRQPASGPRTHFWTWNMVRTARPPGLHDEELCGILETRSVSIPVAAMLCFSGSLVKPSVLHTPRYPCLFTIMKPSGFVVFILAGLWTQQRVSQRALSCGRTAVGASLRDCFWFWTPV